MKFLAFFDARFLISWQSRVTIILAIPTVVSSFFGMNVPVPFAEDGKGFMYVMVIAFGISISSAVILWRRNMF